MECNLHVREEITWLNVLLTVSDLLSVKSVIIHMKIQEERPPFLFESYQGKSKKNDPINLTKEKSKKNNPKSDQLVELKYWTLGRGEAFS